LGGSGTRSPVSEGGIERLRIARRRRAEEKRGDTLFVLERRRSKRLPGAIRARDVRAADPQEESTKRVTEGPSLGRNRFVGSDEDGGSPANIAASEASHRTERT
jgi:hypothetical protein